MVDAFARLGAIGATPAALARLVCENGPVVWLPRVQMLVEEGDLDDLMDAAASLRSQRKQESSQRCVHPRGGEAGVSIAERDDFNELAEPRSLLRWRRLAHGSPSR